jgi:hypothetical protein
MANPTPPDPRVNASNTPTFTTDPVKVLVGCQGEAEQFWVHQHILDSRAEFTGYFASALKDGWQKGDCPAITLPDTKPAVFRAYVHYIYHGTIPVKRDEQTGASDYHFLGLLYAFGELIVDRELQNRVIDALVLGGRDSVVLPEGHQGMIRPVSAVGAIYASTPAGSPARRLMVDYHLSTGKPSWLEQYTLIHASPGESLEFLKELSEAFMQRKKGDYTELTEGIPKSYYHKVVSPK